jgi:hypothetical protein
VAEDVARCFSPFGARRAVEAAVETAYKVYDDYVKWGQDAAARRPRSDDRREPMSNQPPDPMQPMLQMMQLWQDMARMWMGFMAPPMMPWGSPNAPWMPPMWGTQAQPTSEGVPVNVELDTARPASVTLRMRKNPGDQPLSVHLRRQTGDESMRLRFDSPHGLKVRVVIADDQAPGKYSGDVKDDSGAVYGSMTLELSAPKHAP